MIEVNFFGEERKVRVVKASFYKIPKGHYTVKARIEYTRTEDGKKFTAELRGPVVARTIEEAIDNKEGPEQEEALAETISPLITHWIEGIEEWYMLNSEK